DEIKQMIRDAEYHAEEDKKRKETVEARNHLDSLVYSTEKSLKDYGGELDSAVKAEIETALEKAKKVMESQDTQTVRSVADELSRSSHKLAEAIYAKTSQQQQQQPSSQPEEGKTTGDDSKKKEDVVDADFEEVKD
ncbi:MAG: Hsp70 family protein, partial [Deltaproteobacteria bacterium]|nr:Hsp70 family protein [Deltaproteobacteria bacterium]